MTTARILGLVILFAAMAACHPVEEPGGLLEPLEDGVLAQATLDGDVQTGQTEPEPEPEPTPEPEPEPTPEPEPETSEPEPETSEPEPETSAVEDEPALDEPETADLSDEPDTTDVEAELADVGEGATHAADPAAVDSGDEPVAPELPTPEPIPVSQDPEPVRVTLEPVEATPEPAPVVVETVPEPAAELTPPPVVEAPVIDAPPEPVAPVELPEPPPSDADAIAALDDLPRAEPPAAPALEPSAVTTPPVRCEADDPLLAASLGDLEMVRWWSEGGSQRAELSGGGDAVYVVQVGDRVGPDGGKVVRIEPTQVIVGEIGFNLSDEPQITVRPIKLGR